MPKGIESVFYISFFISSELKLFENVSCLGYKQSHKVTAHLLCLLEPT